jgi:glycosyltransferase involved in cell wall biosynthesis
MNFAATDLPYVVTVHDLSFIRFPEFFLPKWRLGHRAIGPTRLIKGAARVVAVSEHTKQDVHELFGVPMDRIVVASPGVSPEFAPQAADDVKAVRARHGLPERYLLFVGTVEPRKNIESVIAAFDCLGGEGHLAIAGGKGWMNRRVYSLAARARRADRIHFLGYVPHADKAALLTGATALVYPSFYEGFGMPPLEAMACGTPVISSHASSMPEVIGDAGLLVNPHDVSAIAEAMQSLITDEAARLIFSERGRARASAFTWAASARRLMDALNS